MEIRRAWIQTGIDWEGKRVPWRISHHDPTPQWAVTGDDRVEEVCYFNEEELEQFKRSVTEITESYYKAIIAGLRKEDDSKKDQEA